MWVKKNETKNFSFSPLKGPAGKRKKKQSNWEDRESPKLFSWRLPLHCFFPSFYWNIDSCFSHNEKSLKWGHEEPCILQFCYSWSHLPLFLVIFPFNIQRFKKLIEVCRICRMQLEVVCFNLKNLVSGGCLFEDGECSCALVC